jgi:hypothetical protein
LREKYRFRVFGKGMLRKIFEDEKKEEEVGEEYIMRSFTLCTLPKIYLNLSNQEA